MSGALRWHRDSRDWPNRDSSLFVEAAGIHWHVQRAGDGPQVLLLHGTGSSTHTWRRLLPALADRYAVIAPDLPGHAFSGPTRGDGWTLPGMAAALAALLDTLDAEPRVIVGHSAGAAIAVRACIDGLIAPDSIVSVNGALLGFRGAAGWLFPPAARLLASSTLVPRLFAWRASDPSVVGRLLADTGSRLDEDTLALYRRLARSPEHVGAALSMMANWDLASLERDLPALAVPLLLLAGCNDNTVAPAQAGQVAARVSDARVIQLAGLGHLAHEERAEPVADAVDALAGRRRQCDAAALA